MSFALQDVHIFTIFTRKVRYVVGCPTDFPYSRLCSLPG